MSANAGTAENPNPQPTTGPADWLWAGLLAGGFLLAYYPVWTGLVRAWSNSDDYSHGFIIVPFSLYVLWRSRERFAQAAVSPSRWGLPLLALGVSAYIVARLSGVMTLSSLSMLPVLAGMVLFLFGWGYLKISLFPIGLLLFAIPVPAQIYSALTLPLQLIVSKATALLASLANIPMLREGNVLQLPEHTFHVVEACSGMRSVMTMLTLGAIFGYLTLRSNALRGVLLVSGVPIAILVNILRVFLMVAAMYHFGIDLVEGPAHEYFGFFIFFAALGVFLALRGALARWDRSAD